MAHFKKKDCRLLERRKRKKYYNFILDWPVSRISSNHASPIVWSRTVSAYAIQCPKMEPLARLVEDIRLLANEVVRSESLATSAKK